MTGQHSSETNYILTLALSAAENEERRNCTLHAAAHVAAKVLFVAEYESGRVMSALKAQVSIVSNNIVRLGT